MGTEKPRGGEQLVRLPPYNMQHASRGPVLIFNNQNYPEHMKMERRAFNDIDVANMYKCMAGLGYKDIRMKRDLSAKQMLNEIEKVAGADHSNNDSVVIIFLAYGEHNIIYTKDRPIGLQILVDPLKGDWCHPSLVGKPKIIISQTCNPMFLEVQNDAESDDEEEEKAERRVVPTEADIVYFGSEVPGLITDRKCTEGSIFITKLSRRLQQDGRNMELRKLMTRTLQDVEEEMDKWDAEWAEKNDERMPYIASMLTRDLYFTQRHT